MHSNIPNIFDTMEEEEKIFWDNLFTISKQMGKDNFLTLIKETLLVEDNIENLAYQTSLTKIYKNNNICNFTNSSI